MEHPNTTTTTTTKIEEENGGNKQVAILQTLNQDDLEMAVYGGGAPGEGIDPSKCFTEPMSMDISCSSNDLNKDRASSADASAAAPANSSCWKHPRFQQMYQTADWWSLWIGLASFGLAVALVFSGLTEIVPNDNYKYLVPQPAKWTQPAEAWDVYNMIGIPVLLTVLATLYWVSLYFMGKLEAKKNDSGETEQHLAAKYMTGFGFMSLLATIAFWLGRNEWLSKHGLGYAVWAIVLGMIVTNATPLLEKWPWLLRAAKDGEFFIKCSLVLLAVELNLLVSVGGPAMLVSWIGSPITIGAGFYLGMKLFDCQDSLSMIIAVGASWCGASAISAVAPIVSASSEEVSLAISVVAFFTIIFTFVQPYLAMAVGMPDDVAGAWIGGSVDQTGNVVVSAAIISDQATEVASIVKMVLNAGLGVMASIISCYWNSRQKEGEEGERRPFNWIMLWDKFPKFTIGFVITSAILTLLMQNLEDGTPEAVALPAAVSSLNRWWFAVAFVGIGLTTNIKKLWEKAWKSGIIQVYLLANAIDILLALGLSYLVYA